MSQTPPTIASERASPPADRTTMPPRRTISGERGDGDDGRPTDASDRRPPIGIEQHRGDEEHDGEQRQQPGECVDQVGEGDDVGGETLIAHGGQRDRQVRRPRRTIGCDGTDDAGDDGADVGHPQDQLVGVARRERPVELRGRKLDRSGKHVAAHHTDRDLVDERGECDEVGVLGEDPPAELPAEHVADVVALGAARPRCSRMSVRRAPFG